MLLDDLRKVVLTNCNGWRITILTRHTCYTICHCFCSVNGVIKKTHTQLFKTQWFWVQKWYSFPVWDLIVSELYCPIPVITTKHWLSYINLQRRSESNPLEAEKGGELRINNKKHREKELVEYVVVVLPSRKIDQSLTLYIATNCL